MFVHFSKSLKALLKKWPPFIGYIYHDFHFAVPLAMANLGLFIMQTSVAELVMLYLQTILVLFFFFCLSSLSYNKDNADSGSDSLCTAKHGCSHLVKACFLVYMMLAM